MKPDPVVKRQQTAELDEFIDALGELARRDRSGAPWRVEGAPHPGGGG